MESNFQANDNEYTVSVIIPCYNSSKTIERCLRSVIEGDLLPMEILVYDDASSDSTQKIVKTLCSEYDSIKLFIATENKGAGNARRFLISKASGYYIAFLDADDTWNRDKLSCQIELCRKYDLDLVTSGYRIVENEKDIGIRLPSRNLNYQKMHIANFLPMSFTMYKRKLICSNEMPLLRLRQDYAFWLRLYKLNRKLKYMGIYRIHGAYHRSSSNISKSKFKNSHANYIMFRQEMQYSVVFSSLFTLMNIVIRLFRT